MRIPSRGTHLRTAERVDECMRDHNYDGHHNAYQSNVPNTFR